MLKNIIYIILLNSLKCAVKLFDNHISVITNNSYLLGIEGMQAITLFVFKLCNF